MIALDALPWSVVALPYEVRRSPLAREAHGIPLVLWRGPDGIVAFEDRCPHRSVPLSMGKVDRGRLRCAYHGWAFGPDGACLDVPGLTREPPSVRVPSARVVVRDGLLWVAGDQAVEGPPTLPWIGAAGTTTWIETETWSGTVLDAARRVLSLRLPAPGGGEVHVESLPDGIAFTRQEPQGVRGLLGLRVDRRVASFHRPGLAQVVYLAGDTPRLAVSACLTPTHDGQVHAWLVVTAGRRGLPGALARRLLHPIAGRLAGPVPPDPAIDAALVAAMPAPPMPDDRGAPA